MAIQRNIPKKKQDEKRNKKKDEIIPKDYGLQIHHHHHLVIFFPYIQAFLSCHTYASHDKRLKEHTHGAGLPLPPRTHTKVLLSNGSLAI